MRIVVAITALKMGGAECLVSRLADEYVSRDHSVLLISFREAFEVIPSNPQVIVRSLAMRRNPISFLIGMYRYRKMLRDFKPDVIHTHLFHANISTRLLRLFTKMTRLITSAHNTHEGGRVRMWAYRLTDHLADISTNVSEDAVQAFEAQRAVKLGQMIIIYNGISTDEFHFDPLARTQARQELNMQDGVALVLAVGRLSEQKDYPSLLKAMSFLKEDPSWRLAVVGDGPLRASLEGFASDLRVGDRVDWLGIRYDVPALMSACDVFVLSSSWEGFGLVVAEAMACERPVVATDCGGVGEVLGDCGLLVPPKDSVVLAEAIKSALRLPEQAKQRLGCAARKRVQERYSIAATSERYLAVYRGEV